MKIKHLLVLDYIPEFEAHESALYDMDTQECIYYASDILEDAAFVDDDIMSANTLAKVIKYVFKWQDEDYTDIDVSHIEVDTEKYSDITEYIQETFGEFKNKLFE